MITTSCGTVAQASGTSSTNSLKFYGSLPPANIQQVYNAKVAVVNGNLRYSFSLKSGSLPPGVTLDPATGTLFGMPSTVGKFSFEVLATDSPLPDQNTQQFIVVVADDSQSVKVAVTPTSANIFSNGTEQFTASVSGTSNTAVTWSATSGSVSGNGLYTAPTVTSPTNVTVTAVSNADPSKSATAAVTIDPQNVQALQITNGSLPQGQQGELYNADFTATGGKTPYT
ncbi:MAG: putative Ig domain-containing protein, partial [Terriglobales bacterium]